MSSQKTGRPVAEVAKDLGVGPQSLEVQRPEVARVRRADDRHPSPVETLSRRRLRARAGTRSPS